MTDIERTPATYGDGTTGSQTTQGADTADGLDVTSAGAGTDVEVYDEYGPPSKWSEREWPLAWMGAFLDALSVLPVIQSAALAAGVSRQWAHVAAQKYPLFAEAWQEALTQGGERFEQHVVKWGSVGIIRRETTTETDAQGRTKTTVKEINDVSPVLAAMVLKRLKPEYRERTGIELTGAEGGPIELAMRERVNEAVERFDSRVVRLAAVRAARADADADSG